MPPTCWRLYTTQDTIVRSDRRIRHGGNCQGRQARRVAIGNDGFPLPGELAAGERVTGPAPVSVRPSAVMASQQAFAPLTPLPTATTPLPSATYLTPAHIMMSLAIVRSRQTRHQDAASRSRQGQAIDFDPTDGLPVQKYTLSKSRVNQDASNEASTTNAKSTNSAEWAAQFNTPEWPWPERPLPSYFHQLSPWNQEMIRRARAGNVNPTVSSWDRKNNCWISGAEQERKAAQAAKLAAQNGANSNEKPRNGDDAESPKSADDSGAEDSSNEFGKSADEDEDEGDEGNPFKTQGAKRRKVSSHFTAIDDSRYIEVTKWVPLAPSQAEKAPDRIFLAPRRPGMPPLYQPEYAQKMFGQYHSSANVTGTAGYDLGEGGGLSNASGVLAAGSANDAGTATPRKNIPPRRKKKKLGGPGRKKNNPNPTAAGDATNAQGSAVGVQGAGDATANPQGAGSQHTGDNATEIPGADDNDLAQDDDNESGSEAEGSEEGEIDEGGATELRNLSLEAPPVPSIMDPALMAVDESRSPSMDNVTPVAIPVSSAPVALSEPVPVAASTSISIPSAPTTEVIANVDTEMTDAQHHADTTTSVEADTQINAPIPETIPHPATTEEEAIVEENATAIAGDPDTTKSPPAISADVTGPIAEPSSPQVDGPSETIVTEPIVTMETEIEPAPAPATATATADVPAPAPAPAATIEQSTAIPSVNIEPAADNDDTVKSQHDVEESDGNTASVQATDTDKDKDKDKERKDGEGSEMDLLGGLDAAIDREVSEGA